MPLVARQSHKHSPLGSGGMGLGAQVPPKVAFSSSLGRALHQPLRDLLSIGRTDALRWHGDLSIDALATRADLARQISLRIGTLTLFGHNFLERWPHNLVVHAMAGRAGKLLQQRVHIGQLERCACSGRAWGGRSYCFRSIRCSVGEG